jgi:hypothetical protein
MAGRTARSSRAGKKSAHGVEIADRLCAFAPAAEPQRQAHDRIIATKRRVGDVAATPIAASHRHNEAKTAHDIVPACSSQAGAKLISKIEAGGIRNENRAKARC